MASFERSDGFGILIDVVRSSQLGLALAVFAVVFAGFVAPIRADEAAEQAKRHNAAARAWFHLGKFKQAAEAYEKAYRAKPVPVFLYNLGQCHKRMDSPEHLERALFYFEGYLNAAPDAPNRRDVEETIAQLRQRIEEQRRAREQEPKERQAQPPAVEREHKTEPSPPPPATKPLSTAKPAPKRARPTPFYKTWWFWTVVGAVLASGAVAVAVTTGGDDWVPSGADGCFTPSSRCE